jgi:hypothetical protein
MTSAVVVVGATSPAAAARYRAGSALTLPRSLGWRATTAAAPPGVIRVSGRLRSNTTWSPAKANADIQRHPCIPKGITLTIDQGTVKAHKDGMKVEGRCLRRDVGEPYRVHLAQRQLGGRRNRVRVSRARRLAGYRIG